MQTLKRFLAIVAKDVIPSPQETCKMCIAVVATICILFVAISPVAFVIVFFFPEQSKEEPEGVFMATVLIWMLIFLAIEVVKYIKKRWREAGRHAQINID